MATSNFKPTELEDIRDESSTISIEEQSKSSTKNDKRESFYGRFKLTLNAQGNLRDRLHSKI
jgi:hypothetical protein